MPLPTTPDLNPNVKPQRSFLQALGDMIESLAHPKKPGTGHEGQTFDRGLRVPGSVPAYRYTMEEIPELREKSRLNGGLSHGQVSLLLDEIEYMRTKHPELIPEIRQRR